MFDFSTAGWRWYNIPDNIKKYLCTEAKFDAATLVKINPVRAVFACGDYFVKFEVPDTAFRRWRSILAPKAASEYASGKALAAAGIPVVEYIGWMRKKSVNVTVSRRWQGGSGTAEEYIFNTLAQSGYGSEKITDFAAVLRDFTLKIQNAGFHHPDYHTGNIMCSNDGRDIVLVDVYGVKKSSPGHWARLAMNRILLPLRQFMDFDTFLDLLSGFPDLADKKKSLEFFRNCRRHDREVQIKAWSKRQQQILSGYPKLVKIEKEYFVRKDETRNPLFMPETAEAENFEYLDMKPEDAFAIFQFSIYLQLCGIRHRRAAAWKAPGTLILEPASAFKSSSGIIAEAEIAALKEETAVFGIGTTGNIACDKYGNPCIYDLPGAFESTEIKSIFY